LKKILLVTDVYGWGGHVRAEYIKKYLSDEFEFDIMDGVEFENFNYKNEIIDDYDLIYLLFHTQLLRKDVNMMLNDGDDRIITIVTSYPTLRASFINGRNKKESIKLFLNRANKCRAILANNQKSLKDLRSLYKGKTFYASRGVDENVFYPTKEFIEKPENEFTVAYVGKPIEEKGLEDIIKPACKQAEVNLIINTRNYTNAFTQDEMREFYNKADAYIVASTMDGTPNTALEAAACGIPLIANRIGNIPELIVDSINGFSINPREVRKYVHRLVWMKKNQRTSWKIGQKGRETILENWTWEKVLNNNERKIFRELI